MLDNQYTSYSNIRKTNTLILSALTLSHFIKYADFHQLYKNYSLLTEALVIQKSDENKFREIQFDISGTLEVSHTCLKSN